jgi:K+/H+ antiporter YhaU regulatory subunit KhtT
MNFTAKIDLTKIDKSKLFKSEKTGAIYLDLVMIESPNNQYGQSHMIVQSVTKEEREKGIKGAILGNAKELEKVEQTTTSAPVQADDLPF